MLRRKKLRKLAKIIVKTVHVDKIPCKEATIRIIKASSSSVSTLYEVIQWASDLLNFKKMLTLRH